MTQAFFQRSPSPVNQVESDNRVDTVLDSRSTSDEDEANTEQDFYIINFNLSSPSVSSGEEQPLTDREMPTVLISAQASIQSPHAAEHQVQDDYQVEPALYQSPSALPEDEALAEPEFHLIIDNPEDRLVFDRERRPQTDNVIFDEVDRFIEKLYRLDPKDKQVPRYKQVKCANRIQREGSTLKIAFEGDDVAIQDFCARIHHQRCFDRNLCFDLSINGVFGLSPVLSSASNFAISWILSYIKSILEDTTRHLELLTAQVKSVHTLPTWTHTCYLIAKDLAMYVVAPTAVCSMVEFVKLPWFQLANIDPNHMFSAMAALAMILQQIVEKEDELREKQEKFKNKLVLTKKILVNLQSEFSNFVKVLHTDNDPYADKKKAHTLFLSLYVASEKISELVRSSVKLYGAYMGVTVMRTAVVGGVGVVGTSVLALKGFIRRVMLGPSIAAAATVIIGTCAHGVYKTHKQKQDTQILNSVHLAIVSSFLTIGCFYQADLNLSSNEEVDHAKKDLARIYMLLREKKVGAAERNFVLADHEDQRVLFRYLMTELETEVAGALEDFSNF